MGVVLEQGRLDFVVFLKSFRAHTGVCHVRESLEAQRGWDVQLGCAALSVWAGTAHLGEHSRSVYQPRVLLGIQKLCFCLWNEIREQGCVQHSAGVPGLGFQGKSRIP